MYNYVHINYFRSNDNYFYVQLCTHQLFMSALIIYLSYNARSIKRAAFCTNGHIILLFLVTYIYDEFKYIVSYI